MSLDVVVVGSGIGGLCAAIALRNSGHSVKVFEKSSFAAETGAAVALSPNGVRVLATLGFSFERARACILPVFESVDGTTLRSLASIDFSAAKEQHGAPFISVHRVDFQRELLRIALDRNAERPITLQLSSAADGVWEDEGSTEEKIVVRLQNGDVHRADLVVCADGVHSMMRRTVLGPAAEGKGRDGLNVFRVLIPTSKFQAEEGLASLREWKSDGTTVFADTTEGAGERHLVWYPCSGGEMQNIAAVHHKRENPGTEDNKTALLSEFGHFHSDIVRLLRLAEDVGFWELPYYEPFPRWTRANAVLVGDAAHPMLPFGAQGANQAIEDAGALGILFSGIQDSSQVPHRLELYEKIRRKRASMIQVLSSVRIGREEVVKDVLWRFAEANASAVPQSFQERIDYALSHDVLNECKKLVPLPN